MTDRVSFADSVTELPHAVRSLKLRAPQPAQPAPPRDEKLTLQFSFAIDKQKEEELDRRVAAGESLSPEELDASYGVAATSTEPLKKWLLDNGYEDVHESADRLSLLATAPASTVASTLDVELGLVSANGVERVSARSAPSLPGDVARGVCSIVGLQPIHLASDRVLRRQAVLAAPASGAVSAPASSAPPYAPRTLLGALGGADLGLDGSGQTIAILIDTVADPNDLSQFWALTGVPGSLARIKTINVTLRSLPPPAGEETLDTEWTSGVAPGAQINVYATGSTDLVSFMAGLGRILVDAALDPTLRVVSISLGKPEREYPIATLPVMGMIFRRLAALGVNVLVSSGDEGSTPGGVLGVEYPASDPNVIAVGGTQLLLDASGAIATETAWFGSGGGASQQFSRPSWQAASGIAPGAFRLVPDIAAPADPGAGALVVLQGAQRQLGGTSWATPVWAGILALANQARANVGKKPLPFLNPQLYAQGAAAGLRDITTGSNGTFQAGPGHDLVTGWGSPLIASLIVMLSGLP